MPALFTIERALSLLLSGLVCAIAFRMHAASFRGNRGLLPSELVLESLGFGDRLVEIEQTIRRRSSLSPRPNCNRRSYRASML